MGKTATVVVTEDGCVPIPPEMQRELGLLPSQTVQVRAEDGHLVVEHPSQEQVFVELDRLFQELHTGEPFLEAWAEIEAGREDHR